MHLRTLGGLELDGSDFSRPKPLLLLSYVALEGPQDRRHLAELFWRDAADHLKSLSVALAQLRSGAPGCIDADRHQVRAAVEIDAARLVEALAAGRPEEAVGLYRGPFLGGFHLPALGVEVEEWIYQTREALASRVQREILVLAEAEAAAEDFDQAARRAEAGFRLPGAPSPEDDELLRFHRLLLAGGSPLEGEVRHELEDLEIEGIPEDPESTRRELRRTARETDVPPRHNLPARRTSFVGRESQLDLVAAALRASRCRLVTLLGPAGVGKTRLAIESARRELEERGFPGGVFFVGLAAVFGADGVAPKIADALGLLGRTTRSPRDELVGHLAGRRTLLVLDNVEHLLEAADLVADLLESCPRLSILTTSRIPLRLQGEQELPIRPLAVPAAAGEDEATLRRSPAVRLFLERASSIRPDLPEDSGTLEAVAEICRRLDGLPLAIELAAARVRLFSPTTMAEGIGGRLDLLKGGSRDLPERHRTLRQAIAWGHDLLTPAERRLFRRCGVFAGGFEAETATRFGQRLRERLDGGGAAARGTLGALEGLVENSLVQAEAAGDRQRFFLLETVREFALERLEEAGEEEQVRRAHAQELLTLARERAAEATGPTQSRWLQRLRVERENLEAALRWAESRGEMEVALGIANAVWRLWLVSDPLDRGVTRFERLLRLPDPGDESRERSLALNALGTLRHEMGELEAAREALEESLVLCRRRGDREDTATVLNNLSWTHVLQGHAGAARRLAGEAARICKEAGERRGMAVALNNLGWIHHLQGRYDKAARSHRKGLELRILVGDRRGEAYARANLAWAETYRGRLDEAERLADAALSILRELEDDQLIAWGLFIRALPATARGELDAALDLLRRSVARWHRVGNRVGLAWALAAEGQARAGGERAVDALQPLRDAVTACRDTGSHWPLVDVLPWLARLSPDGASGEEAANYLCEAAQVADRLGARSRLRAACEAARVPLPS